MLTTFSRTSCLTIFDILLLQSRRRQQGPLPSSRAAQRIRLALLAPRLMPPTMVQPRVVYHPVSSGATVKHGLVLGGGCHIQQLTVTASCLDYTVTYKRLMHLQLSTCTAHSKLHRQCISLPRQPRCSICCQQSMSAAALLCASAGARVGQAACCRPDTAKGKDYRSSEALFNWFDAM